VADCDSQLAVLEAGLNAAQANCASVLLERRTLDKPKFQKLQTTDITLTRSRTAFATV
jgi:hypothetical protein